MAEDGSTVVMDGKIADLCECTVSTGSLNKSAKRLGMAYSNAWKLITSAEACLGYPLMDRHPGLGSKLTERGADLVDAYNMICHNCGESVDKLMLA